MAAVPLLWAVLSSLKSNQELFGSPWALPEVWRFDNFARAWTQADIGGFFFNTVIVVGGSLVLPMAKPGLTRESFQVL